MFGQVEAAFVLLPSHSCSSLGDARKNTCKTDVWENEMQPFQYTLAGYLLQKNFWNEIWEPEKSFKKVDKNK